MTIKIKYLKLYFDNISLYRETFPLNQIFLRNSNESGLEMKIWPASGPINSSADKKIIEMKCDLKNKLNLFHPFIYEVRRRSLIKNF